MKIVLAGLLENISTRSDGTLKIVFGTQEIEPQQAGELFQLRGKYSKLLLSDDNITPVEENVIQESNIQDGRKIKSKSQKMRALLYLIWKKSSDGFTNFDEYYNHKMDSYNDTLKNKLDEFTL